MCWPVVRGFSRLSTAAATPARKKLYVGQSRPEAPVVCYNGWVTKFDELQKMADAECVKHQTGDYAEPVEQDVFTCRLLTPAAWKFKCVKKEEAERTDQ